MKTGQVRLDRLRHETWLVMRVTARDTVKRLAGSAMILVLCWYAGFGRAAMLVAGMVVLFELVFAACIALAPDCEDDLSLRLISMIWVNNFLSMFAFLCPGIILASQGSVPLLLVGYVWVFGVFVHITNTFVALPIYNWTMMVPGFLALAVLMFQAAQQDFMSGKPIEWWFAAAILVVYASNTFQTLSMQKDTQRALEQARAEAKARMRELEHRNRHDQLTGLLTRTAFDAEVLKMLADRRPRREVAVLLIDLDGFKPINDTYSHDAGDAILAALGKRLGEAVGMSGHAARFGGDEFAMAFADIATPDAAMRIAERVANCITDPVTHAGITLRVGASVGVSLSSGKNNSVATLCKTADQAMFRAKSRGTGGACLYTEDRFPKPAKQHDRGRLLRAMSSDEVVPFYQPKVALDSGAIIGFEALARWVHPDRGLMAASEFLPRIEEEGLQGAFLAHMAERVFGDISALLVDGVDPGRVSINLPEATLATRSGRDQLDRLIDAFPAVGAHITFEITEDVFVARACDQIRASISHFRARGLQVSLDDFGTGFASFQHLRQLEFDELKIDQSFVAGLGNDHTAEVLIDGFLRIAAGLGVPVIAKGVETGDQRAQLLRMGCRIGQGFLFGRAVPFADIRALLIADAADHTAPRIMRAGA